MDELGGKILSIKLGEIHLEKGFTPPEMEQLKQGLDPLGFELLESQSSILISSIKTALVELIHHSDRHLKVNFSTYLADKLKKDYTYLSRLFSSVEGITIEKFITAQKIEKVKELIFYNEMTFTEIAFSLNYSSVAHLSAQFKKETGMTPSQFKAQGKQHRHPIDRLTPKS